MQNILRNWQTIRRRAAIRTALFCILFVLLYVALHLGVSIGAVDIDSDTVSRIIQDRIAERLHLDYNSGLDYTDRNIELNARLILDIRLPRVILAGLVGAGLALAGAALQGVFRNPLADPGLIGISSGAAVGAVTAILLHLDTGNILNFVDGERLAQAILAFIAGLLTTALVYSLAYQRRHTDSATLLLIGLAINSIAASYIGMATYIAGQEQVGDIVFWTLGSVAAAFWRDVYIMLPFTVLGVLALPTMAKQLNLMALGETEARHLGVDVERLRITAMGISALMVGIATALVGIIAFVGLVVPHFIRMLFGPDHRILLPASAIGGAAFLIAADLIARTLASTSEVPPGVVTTLVGGPFFLFLILVYRRGKRF